MIDLDGFDSGVGKISAPDWRSYAREIGETLGVTSGKSLFEVGCGSGAFLYVMREMGADVGGLDFSAGLVDYAKRSLPGSHVVEGSAIDLPVEPHADVVVANSVFHYFPDDKYAESVLNRMLTKARSAVAVLDLPDLKTREEAEQVRSSGLSAEEYRKKYAGLSHKYFDREWFTRHGARGGWSCTTVNQKIDNYPQSQFRFNAIFTRAQVTR